MTPIDKEQFGSWAGELLTLMQLNALAKAVARRQTQAEQMRSMTTNTPR